jgi:hypothetical protein
MLVPSAEKMTLVLEGIGDDKIRINSTSLESPLTVFPTTIEKKLYVSRVLRPARYLDVDPSGMADAGYDPERN